MSRLRVRSLSLAALAALAVAGMGVGPAHAQATFNSFAAFQAATSGLTTELFDAAPWSPSGTPLTQPVVNLGVSWTSANNLISTTVIAFSGTQSISDNDGTPDVTDVITAQLPAGVSAVGGFINNFSQSHGVTLTAFSSANDVLGQITSPSGTNSWFFLGLTTTAPVARVTFVSTVGTNDDFALDSFSFGQSLASASAAPEPGTLSLLALTGLPVVAAIRRRCRRPA